MKIVVIVIDALRADSLSCYGYPLETSPGIDRIAGEGVLFENAYTQANWTNPSLYSFLTGLYPSVHGVSGFNQNLGDKVATLPGLLAGVGYRTFLFSNYYVLLGPQRLGKHFQESVYFEIDGSREELRRKLTDNEKFDLFAVVHVGNYIHEPYCASSDEVGRFWKGPFPKRKIIRALTEEAGLDDESMKNVLRSVNLRRERLSRKEISFLKACYDAGIRHVDAWVEGFFDFLTSSGMDDVIFMITADHGQSFLEHGFFGHGLNLHQELIRVPLILRGRGSRPGKVVESYVQLTDIFPTLLDILGLDLPSGIDGISFWKCLEGEAQEERWVISEGFPFAAAIHHHKKLIISFFRLMGWREGLRTIFALIRSGRWRRLLLYLYSLLQTRFYDLRSDPGEEKNRSGGGRAELKKMKRYMKEWYRQCRIRALKVTEQEIEEERTMEQLKSLGYL